MNALLRGVSGPVGGSQVAVEGGGAVLVGRDAACTLSVPADRFLSARHFEIGVRGGQVFLLDRDSRNGTFVNGARTRECALRDGDSILAGESTFCIQFQSAAAPPSVVDFLSDQDGPLYAVLDAARDPAIYPLLLAGGASYWCLYTGQSARTLETVAPYLALLPPRCELLQKIVAQGWGNSWGIFLTSKRPPETVWHELRRSLMVQLEDTGKWVYFRFYDPRVLRVFLPMADAEQRAEFVGTIGSFLVEDEDAKFLLRFRSLASTGALERLKVLNDRP